MPGTRFFIIRSSRTGSARPRADAGSGGDSDRIVSPDYGRAYAGLIPGSRFSLIERAGHHPEIEQPEVFAEQVLAFLREEKPAHS